jgi:ATP-dependent DNA helicase RecG
MEKAIEVMRQSVHEPRPDGKASPLVGAVIYKPDGTIETASRGELRYGDHAEYTLLERKNRNCRLDGSILFATLEPCAPGSRRHPKLSCAERIVLARIKEVWVGMEDPDPTVDRKGIKYLQDCGLTVHMFDRDLQDTIRESNKEFIAQAMERAAAVTDAEKPKTVILSKFENAFAAAATEDFSSEALKQYKAIAKIMEEIGSPSFNRRLMQQGLLKQQNGTFTPTGFGLLLFGKEPRTAIQQAGLLGTIHFPDGKEEPRDFDGPMVLIPGQVEQWLRDKLPSTIDRTRMQRRETPALPFELVREAVVNALVHRDYDIAGAKCQLIVTPDTISVKSPGGPPMPIKLEQLQAFKAPMLSRNPELHYVFARMDLAEERGLGMKTLRSVPEQHGLPLPKYSFEDPYLVLTLYRSPEGVTQALPPKLLKSLNEEEIKGWEFLASKTATTRAEYEEHMRFDKRKAQRHLKRFVELGLLRPVGAGPSASYAVIGR